MAFFGQKRPVGEFAVIMKRAFIRRRRCRTAPRHSGRRQRGSLALSGDRVALLRLEFTNQGAQLAERIGRHEDVVAEPRHDVETRVDPSCLERSGVFATVIR